MCVIAQAGIVTFIAGLAVIFRITSITVLIIASELASITFDVVARLAHLALICE
jgi:hypothetical protein